MTFSIPNDKYCHISPHNFLSPNGTQICSKYTEVPTHLTSSLESRFSKCKRLPDQGVGNNQFTSRGQFCNIITHTTAMATKRKLLEQLSIWSWKRWRKRWKCPPCL
jgi:hypothetical protein